MAWDPLSWALWLLLGAGAAYLTISALLFIFQRRLVYAANPFAPETVEIEGRPPEVLVSQAEGGPLCRHWLWSPTRPDKPVVCFLQGNAGNIGARADSHAFLVEAGYGLFLVGYRGFGGNPGVPGEEGLIEDATAALAALRQRLPGAKTLLYGESLGAAVAIALASRGERAPLVLDGPFDRLLSPAKARYPWLLIEPFLRDKWDSLARVAAVEQPLLWMHGSEDPVTPLKFGQRLFDAADCPKTALIVEGGLHLGLLEDPDVRATFLDWIESHIKAEV